MGSEIHLTCIAAPGVETESDALCEALAVLLRAGDPPREVLVVDDGTDADRPWMILGVSDASATDITAQIEWELAEGVAGRSPEMQVSVTDSTLSDASFQQLARGLLRRSDWPGSSK